MENISKDDVLIIVYGSDTIDSSHEIIQKYLNKIVVFEIDARLPQHLKRANINIRTFENYLPESNLQNINEYITNTFGHDLVINKINYTRWNQFSVGSVGFKFIRKSSILVLKNVLSARACIEEFNPTIMFIGSGLGMHLNSWNSEGQSYNIRTELLNKDKTSSLDQKKWNLFKEKKSFFILDTLKVIQRKISIIKYKTLFFFFSYLNNHKQKRSVLINYHDSKLRNDLIRYLIKKKLQIIKFENYEPLFRIDKINIDIKNYFLNNYSTYIEMAKKLKTLNYKNVDLSYYLEKDLKTYFIILARYAQLIDSFSLFIEKIKPSCFITTSNVGYQTYIYNQVCKNYKIPVIVLHSQYNNALFSKIVSRPIGDYFICWAYHMVNYYKKHNVKNNNILQMEMNLSNLQNYAGDKKYSKKELGIVLGKKNVLLIGSRYTDTDAVDSPLDQVCDQTEDFINTAKEMKDVNFIIKFHPGLDTSSILQKQMKIIDDNRLHNLTKAPLDSNPYDYLESCDGCVMYVSTLGFEFMLKNKFAFMLIYSGKKGSWPLENNYDDLIKIKKMGDLTSILKKILFDKEEMLLTIKKQQKFLKEIFIFNKKSQNSVIGDILSKENII